MRHFFGFARYTWQSVYYHFNEWSQTEIWEKCYQELLNVYKSKLDMSLINLDASHCPAKRGGDTVGYQNRKKSKTTNIFIFTDR
tara:strand:- start:523 stop:774 length:252 start_codon:yes stop_codon:yes gene_type:complete